MIQLLQLTDLHITSQPGDRLRGIDPRASLDAVWAQAQAEFPQADAVLLTGDLTDDGSVAGYEHLREVFCHSQRPVLCIPGNHDDPVALRATLTGAPFVCSGTVDLGEHWRVHLLDSHLPGAVGGRLTAASAAQLARIGQDDDEGRFHLLALHHPPISMDSAWLDACGLLEPEALLACVDGNERIRAVTWGHAHQARDEWRGQARLLCTPSTNTQFAPGAADFAVDESGAPGYRLLQLTSQGQVATTVRRLAMTALTGPPPRQASAR